jgi:hypothetical protein
MMDGMIRHNRNCAISWLQSVLSSPMFVGRRPNKYDVLSTLTLPVQGE